MGRLILCTTNTRSRSSKRETITMVSRALTISVIYFAMCTPVGALTAVCKNPVGAFLVCTAPPSAESRFMNLTQSRMQRSHSSGPKVSAKP